MKKGRFLEVLRVAMMYVILEKEDGMSASDLGKFLGCGRNMVIEYVRAHQNLFEMSNNGISSKKVFLKPSEKGNKDPRGFIIKLISFAENFCGISSDDILTKKFIEWFRKNSEPFNQ